MTKPDGQPRRALDTSRAEREFGFKATMSFREGLRRMVDWYQAQRVEEGVYEKHRRSDIVSAK